MGFGVIWPQLQSTTIAGRRFGQIRLAQEGSAEVVVRLGIVEIHCDFFEF
jgi:hypothetical protein